MSDNTPFMTYREEAEALRTENAAQKARIESLERAVKQNDDTARHYLAGRTESLQENQQLRAMLARAREAIIKVYGCYPPPMTANVSGQVARATLEEIDAFLSGVRAA